MNIVRNVPYRKTENGILHFDLYDPEVADAPLIIYMADGVNRSAMDSRLLYRLLDAQYAVATISYGDYADCRYAVRWLQTNIGDYTMVTDSLALWGVGNGGFIALQLGLRGEADAVCTMQVDFPKTGLHETVTDKAAVFLMLQAADHTNIKQITQLDITLRQAQIGSQLVTLDSGDLSDEAAATIGTTMTTFFNRWVR